MDKTIPIIPEEAMLIDWVLTMHTYDSNRLEQLEREEFKELRKKAASTILGVFPEITLQSSEIQYLLITVPITFRFGKEDVGFSLKRKLLATIIPPRINWNIEEVKNEDNNSTSKDNPESNTKDSA